MNRLKQLLPFVFPTAAIVLVAILAVRWYRLRSERMGQISEFAEGVEIEDLTDNGMMMVNDYDNVAMTSQDETAEGQIRYELADGRVRFSVTAYLPEEDGVTYQVWLQDLEGTSIRRAFTLEMLKGGYTGSAAISDETLPFEVLVSREMVNDNAVEEVLLRGTLEMADQSN